LRVLVEALDTFAEILQKIAPAHKLAKDWEAAIFVDYMSLYQFPRTEEQDVYFAKGMANMHLLYAHDETWSLRIEDLTPGLHDRPGPELSGTAKVFYLPENAVTDVALAELRDTNDQGSCSPGCHFGCRPPCPQLHRNSTPYRERGWCMAEVQWSLARFAAWKSIRIPFREGRNSEAPMAPSEFRAQVERGTLKFTHRADLEPVLQLQAKVFREKAAEATNLNLAHLPEAQVQVLARALPHYERLEELYVGRSELAGEAFQALVRALPWSHLRQLKLIYSGFGDAEAEVGAHPLRLLCLSRSVAASQKWRGRVLCGVLLDFRGRFFLRGCMWMPVVIDDFYRDLLHVAPWFVHFLRRDMSLEKMKSQQPKSSIHEQTCGRPNLANQALGAGLGGHSSLRVLWLHGNRIGDSGLQAWGGGKGSESAGPEDILDIRLRHKDLRELSLSKNIFGDAGTQAWS
ncbi:NLRC3, partial [Symbiodinium natans]